MNHEYMEKTLKSARTFLSRWEDVDSRVIQLTRSHATLNVLLENPSREGNLYISCIDPWWMHGPFQWRSAGLKLDTFIDHVKGSGFVLTDADAGFELRFGGVEIAENVKLKARLWELEAVKE